MKTIIDNTNNKSKYIFDDNVTLTITNQHIVTPDFIIGDLNSTNSTLYENVTDVPEDWEGCKYYYSDSTWTLDLEWVEQNRQYKEAMEKMRIETR